MLVHGIIYTGHTFRTGWVLAFLRAEMCVNLRLYLYVTSNLSYT